MKCRTAPPVTQSGFALMTSLLLLMIMTIIALSMFRSFGTQEHIAGNLREKDRALHAATSAQQYAEWWLLQGTNSAVGAVACAAGTLSANAGEGQICNQTLAQFYGVQTVPTTLPWAIQTTYLPTGMSVTAGVPGANNDPPYAATPAFYVSDLGPSADGQGEAYMIDAYGYGGATASVAVVESTYEVQQGVVNRSGL
jgi:type IV pilus assembly protein PilX